MNISGIGNTVVPVNHSVVGGASPEAGKVSQGSLPVGDSVCLSNSSEHGEPRVSHSSKSASVVGLKMRAEIGTQHELGSAAVEVPGVDSGLGIPPENVEDAAPAPGRSADFKSVARKAVGVKGDINQVKVASGTEGDDTIAVHRGENGGLIVNINGEDTTYSHSDAEKLVIDGGAGNDRIVVDNDVFQAMYITGGAGNDYIVGGRGNDVIVDNYGSNYINGGRGDDTIIANGLDYDANSRQVAPGGLQSHIANGAIDGNVLVGGAGADYIEGGRGNDLIAGGSGNDVIYGMGGNDRIVSGSGRDYVDGGRGDDVIRSSSGNNNLFGGEGSDEIRGGSGRDVLVGGPGNNHITAKSPDSHVIRHSGDTVDGAEAKVSDSEPLAVPANFRVSGSESFQERVNADLTSIASTPTGQSVIAGIGETKASVSFQETQGGNKCSSGSQGHLQDDRKPGTGSSSTVYYNTSRINLNSDSPWQERPPMVGLYHEMVHSYNAAHGDMDSYNYDYNGGYAQDMYGVNGSEFQAVGIEHRMIKPNPEGVSENDMRAFLNLTKRERY